ncbi:MAG TPA: hypothetical protein VIJ55_15955 [Acetobacteraceae bacterium]
MRTLILTSAALAFAVAAPAFAATDTTGPAMNPSGVTGSTNGSAQMNNPASGPGTAALRSKIHGELSRAGFTDIHVMPQSFLVRAKDSSGNPVMMVINPDSVTAITRMSGPSANQSAQNGAAGSNGAMGSSTMNDSAHAGSAINSPNGNGTTVR